MSCPAGWCSAATADAAASAVSRSAKPSIGPPAASRVVTAGLASASARGPLAERRSRAISSRAPQSSRM